MTEEKSSRNFANCCRTCLKDTSSRTINIFNDKKNSINIAEMLFACTGLTATADDNLPKTVCCECYQNLASFYEFYLVARKIDTHLRQTINYNNNDNILQKSLFSNIKTEFDDVIDNFDCENEPLIDIKIEDRDIELEENKNGSMYIDVPQLKNENNIDTKLFNNEDVIFNCEICHKKFKNLTKLHQHQGKHNSKQNLYICNICSKTFNQKNKLVKHLVLHSHENKSNDNVPDISQSDTNENFTCTVCSSSFRSAHSLSAHMRKHVKKGRVLACNLCDKIFTKVSHLKRHELCHSDNRPFKCTLCPKTFISENYLTEHLNKHNGIKSHVCHENKRNVNVPDISQSDINENFTCTVCSSSFRSMHSLSAHMRKHVKKGRVLACNLCDKIFTKVSHLKRHELCHSDNRPFKCTLCPKTFISENYLTEHLNKHNGIKPHVCALCSKRFSHLSTLTNHIKVHGKEKTYLCSTCGKRFNSSTNLNQHLKRHIGFKSFVCNLCPKQFISKGELKSHVKTHTGERSYTCDQCNGKFTKRSSLVKHKLRHLGVKPYKCDVCPMKFSSKDHLKRHYRIHTGEKPYRCEICDRAFTQSNDLVKHRRAHLGDKLYKCSQCEEGFRLQTELRQHISQHYISQYLKTNKTLDPKDIEVPPKVSFDEESQLNHIVSINQVDNINST